MVAKYHHGSPVGESHDHRKSYALAKKTHQNHENPIRIPPSPTKTSKNPTTHPPKSPKPTRNNQKSSTKTMIIEKSLQQNQLFRCQALPSGLRYVAEFISPTEEEEVLQAVNARAWLDNLIRGGDGTPTGWCPPVISWFINPINYSYIYHKP